MIDLFGLPLTSILLFVLAGLLVGYLLWFPDRSRQKEKLEGLESRYWKARGTARERKTRFLDLRRDKESLGREFDRLKTDHDALQAKHSDTDHRLAECRRELIALRGEKETQDASLDAERRRNDSLVAQMQETLELRASAEREQQEQVALIADLNRQIETLNRDLEQTQQELHQKTESVEEREQSIDELQTESAAALEELRTELQSNLDEKANALERTEKDLMDRCADLDELRGKYEETEQALQRHQTQSRYVDAERDRINEIVQQRDDMAADLQSAADSLGQQRELLEAREVDFNLLNEELAHLRTELKDATALLDQNAETQRELIETVDQRDTRITQLEQQLIQLESAEDRVLELSNSLESHDQTIEHLRGDLNAQREQNRIQQTLIESLEVSAQELVESKQKCELLKGNLETLQTEAYEMTLQINTLRSLETDHQSLSEQYNTSSERVNELEEQLAAKDTFIERQNSDLRKLAEEIDVLEPLQEQLTTARQQLTDVHSRCEHLQMQCEASREENDQLQLQAAQIPELQQEIEQLLSKLRLSQEETTSARSRVDELNRKLNDLRVLFDETQTLEASLRSEIGSLSDELTTMTRHRSELAIRNQELLEKF
ncbi:MAG: hypothetical protein AAGI63_06300, partial [Planctomycetota bacterium]